jgi:alkylglycerol monooxygenase
LENNPLAINLEWIKYSLIMVTLVVYTLPVWIEWTLGVSILINGLLLLFRKADIINATGPMVEASN